MYPREGRAPTGVTTRANAHVTNGAGYAQESLSLLHGRLLLGGGLRFDEFRYDVADRVIPDASGVQCAGRWQGKGNAAFTPSQRAAADVARQLRPRHQQHRCARRGAASGSAAAGDHRFLPGRHVVQFRPLRDQHRRCS